MMIALVQSLRSPDPNTQVGACITDPTNVVIGTGYNGWPRGISNNALPWNREGSPEETKYSYVVHAESNAILNSRCDVTDGTLYVTLHPCAECAKLIIQTRITRIVYLRNPYEGTPQVKAAQRMFEILDLEVEQLEWDQQTLKSFLQRTCDFST